MTLTFLDLCKPCKKDQVCIQLCSVKKFLLSWRIKLHLPKMQKKNVCVQRDSISQHQHSGCVFYVLSMQIARDLFQVLVTIMHLSELSFSVMLRVKMCYAAHNNALRCFCLCKWTMSMTSLGRKAYHATHYWNSPRITCP